MFFWKKERQVEEDIEQYLQETERCIEAFGQAMAVYLQEGVSAQFELLMEKTRQHESAADDKRRDIELAMYSKALIPESRGDILGMLEALDLVPNKSEDVLHLIWMQVTVVPKQFIGEIENVIRINIETHAELCKTVRSLFSDVKRVHELAGNVDAMEGKSDQAEKQLIRSIFRSDIDKADKILFMGLVRSIGSISDRSENAADRLSNIAVKRQS